jgi:hypothetical protein
MPTSNPTGFETYIYDHRQYANPDWHKPIYEGRQHATAPLHDPQSLPKPKCDSDSSPRIMVEPSYASYSNDVWLYFREGYSIMLPRLMAEQLRDALIKVCEKPKQKEPSWETPVVPAEV